MTFPWATTVKLAVFALASLFVLGIMWNTLLNVSPGKQLTFYAQFADASGLRLGDSVRVAGVGVGKVTKIELAKDYQARVKFTVNENTPVQANTAVLIRYENLIGQRYLALREGPGSSARLEEGATVPPTRTESALDLSVLMNGFDPLFDMLSPEDLNQVATTIVQVLQGEGASFNELLHEVGTISGDLAEHDELIGRLVTNLARVVTNLAENDDQFSDLVVETRDFVKALAQDREAIGASIEGMSELTGAVTTLLTDIRPALKRDLVKANRVLGIYARDREIVSDVFVAMEDFASRTGRLVERGSWGDLYPCRLQTNLAVGADPVLETLLLGTTQSEACR